MSGKRLEHLLCAKEHRESHVHGLSPGDGATAIKHAWANVDPSVRNDYEETAASMQVEYDQKLKPYCSFSMDWTGVVIRRRRVTNRLRKRKRNVL